MTVRRLKTYTAETGHVYQYYFVGHRPALESFGERATEYVFDISSDRRTTSAISVFLLETAAASWAANHGRALGDNERYAAAKLRLQRAFDEIDEMSTTGRQLLIHSDELEELLQPLDL